MIISSFQICYVFSDDVFTRMPLCECNVSEEKAVKRERKNRG